MADKTTKIKMIVTHMLTKAYFGKCSLGLGHYMPDRGRWHQGQEGRIKRLSVSKTSDIVSSNPQGKSVMLGLIWIVVLSPVNELTKRNRSSLIIIRLDLLPG